MIRSSRNPRLQDIRRVRKCKDDRALLEGPHLLGELLRGRQTLPEIVLVTPRARGRDEIEELLRSIPEPLVHEVDEPALAKVTDSRTPVGLASVARIARAPLDHLSPSAGLWLYVDGIQDPGNLGALSRVAESVGAHALVLGPGTVHPNHPRALRASAGSLLRLPSPREVAPQRLAEHLPEHRWAGLEAHGGSDPYRTEIPSSLVLALGAEGPGLSPEALRRIELRLTIPLAAPVESLNATVAAALVLFELRRQSLSPAP